MLLEIDTAAFPPGIAYDEAELEYFMSHAGGETLVLEEEGRIAAFLIMSIDRRRRRATLVTLDVRAEDRRRGFATLLLRRSEQILDTYGIPTYDLQVDVHNAAAIGFYRGLGFETVRTLKRYYSNGNDAFLMIKTLRPDGGA